MKRGLEMVRDFHDKFGVKTNEDPSLLSSDWYETRYKLMEEENNEYLEACKNEDIVEIADALGDKLYILLGTILSHGMQDVINDVFVEIHRSNMSKLDKDGNAIINGENGIYDERKPKGKILKGDGFTPPNIDGIFEKYYQDALTKKFLDDELKEHLNKSYEIRDEMFRKFIKDELTPQDWRKFKRWEELSDMFAERISFLQKRGSFDETSFGVVVDGKEMWLDEKISGKY